MTHFSVLCSNKKIVEESHVSMDEIQYTCERVTILIKKHSSKKKNIVFTNFILENGRESILEG